MTAYRVDIDDTPVDIAEQHRICRVNGPYGTALSLCNLRQAEYFCNILNEEYQKWLGSMTAKLQGVPEDLEELANRVKALEHRNAASYQTWHEFGETLQALNNVAKESKA